MQDNIDTLEEEEQDTESRFYEYTEEELLSGRSAAQTKAEPPVKFVDTKEQPSEQRFYEYTEEELLASKMPTPFSVEPEVEELPESIGESITPPEQAEEMPKMSYEDAAQDAEFVSAIRAYALDRGDDLGYDPSKIENMSNDELIEDWMDHYRWSTMNTITASSTGNYVYKLSKDYDIALENGDTEKARQLRDKLQTVSTLLSKTDQVATIFDSERYKDKGYLAAAGDIVDTVGSYLASSLIDPLTVASAGVGKIVAVNAIKAAASTPLKSALKSALASAPIDAAASAYVDTQVQGMYIEAGLQDEYDYGRTAAIASGSAVLSGVVSTAGTYKALKSDPKFASGTLTAKEKEYRATTAQAAAATADAESASAAAVRDRLAAEIDELFGDGAVKRNKKGTITGLDTDVISNSALGKRVFVSDDAPADIENTIGVDSLKRLAATTIDVIEGLKSGDLRITSAADSTQRFTADELTSPLFKDETVSQRLINILSHADRNSKKKIARIAGQYGLTRNELAGTAVIEASEAGRKLYEFRRIRDVLNKYKESGEELAESESQRLVSKFGESYATRITNAYRGLLVSGIPTYVRNTMGSASRVGIETLVWGFEQGLRRAVGKDGKITYRGLVSQFDYAFRDRETAAEVTQFLLSSFEKQRNRFYQNYSEAVQFLKNENPAQNSRVNTGVTAIENGVKVLNTLNLHQEAVYRNAAFSSYIERHLIDKGMSLSDFNSVNRMGDLMAELNEEVIAKATDFALKSTYATRPENQFLQSILTFMNKNPATFFVMPFPRFMFHAMEMAWNYNILTGLPSAMYRSVKNKMKGGEAFSDEILTKYSEAIAGGAPLMALGYYLTDPDNGLLGENWYDLKVGKQQVDIRAFFPLTPYVLMGHMMHRYDDDRQLTTLQEALEGFTGTGFRGNTVLTDLADMAFLQGEATPGEFKDTLKKMGELIGSATVGFGVPIWQFGDIKVNSEYIRDFRTDDDYNTNLQAFFDGVSEPWMRRIMTMTGGGEEYPLKGDPMQEDPPEKSMPFMKLFFGANLSRLPPEHMVKLSQWGFKYTDFMAKGPNKQMNNITNRYMGYLMQRQMPELIHMLENGGFSEKDQIVLIDDELSYFKKYAKEMAMEHVGEKAPAIKELSSFMRKRIRARRRAIELFEEEFNRQPDKSNVEDLDILNGYAENIADTVEAPK